jgi:hypothetical protein
MKADSNAKRLRGVIDQDYLLKLPRIKTDWALRKPCYPALMGILYEPI